MATKIKVTAPNAAYRGSVGEGEHSVTFTNGEAEVASDSPLLRYFREAGYGVGSDEPTQPTAPEQHYPDPHEPSVQVGTPLRDAAVDPRPEDYLEPVGAGTAHPHSPEVVSPGIHGVGPKPLRPGDVYVDDVARQEAEELELTARVIRDDEPATIIAEDFVSGEQKGRSDAGSPLYEGGNLGPLGLSDPGSVKQGVEGAVEVRKAEAEARRAAGEPAAPPRRSAGERPGSAGKKADWVDYAVSRGLSREEAEDLSIAKLQERYPAEPEA